MTRHFLGVPLLEDFSPCPMTATVTRTMVFECKYLPRDRFAYPCFTVLDPCRGRAFFFSVLGQTRGLRLNLCPQRVFPLQYSERVTNRFPDELGTFHFGCDFRRFFFPIRIPFQRPPRLRRIGLKLQRHYFKPSWLLLHFLG